MFHDKRQNNFVFPVDALWIYVVYSAYTVSLYISLLSIFWLIPEEISVTPEILTWKTIPTYQLIFNWDWSSSSLSCAPDFQVERRMWNITFLEAEGNILFILPYVQIHQEIPIFISSYTFWRIWNPAKPVS